MFVKYITSLVILNFCLTSCGIIGYNPQGSLVDFCSREPSHALCYDNTINAINKSDIDEVRVINSEGNKQFKFHADIDDVWRTTGQLGDCEDYSLWKYQRLHEAGYSPKLIIYTRYVGPHRTLHAVVSVEVNGTEWVLDNETSDIREISNTERFGSVIIDKDWNRGEI